jgi:nucleotide-binding universal stress UspA family protein
MTLNTGESGDKILVGFDGSECSKPVLGWAALQAHLTNSTLEIVTAWESAFEQVAAVAARHRDIIDNVQATYSDVAMRSVVLVGRPTQMLCDAARGAKLLVVGRAGHGAVSGTLLGSVSEYCVHHAPCPVVVIR